MARSSAVPAKMPRLLTASKALALTLFFFLTVLSASADNQPPAELPKTLSSLNISFETTSQALTSALNQMIGKELYKGATKTGGLSTDIVRNGPVSVAAVDNRLYLTVPVSMSLRYGGYKTPAISSSLKFRLNAKVTPDWKIDAEIFYMGLSDLFAEEAGIGLISIKPRSIIEGLTQPLQKVISDAVSRKINEKYSLKAEVEKVWNAAQKPILLDKNYNAWLRVAPQEVMLFPLYASGNQVRLCLGLKSFTELVIGPEPPVPAPVPLPGLKPGLNSDRSFSVALNTDIFYKDLVSVAAPMLLNRELGSDGKSIILKSLDIYGSGDRLMVKVEATGSYNGSFTLTCRPSFNPQTNIFSVEDVDFDMDTRNLLLKAANWLMHGKIRNIIKEKLDLNLTQRMQQVHEMAEKAMKHAQLTDRIFLEGSVKDLRLRDVIVNKEKISIQVCAEGESTVRLQ